MSLVQERPKKSVLRCLRDHTEPISAETIAEITSYSVQHIWRVLAALRADELLESSRPHRCHALAYRINEPAAIERGLLP